MGTGLNAPSTNTVSWNTLSTFSSFSAVGDQSVVLPIELLSFKALAKDNVVQLLWQTASEVENDFFTKNDTAITSCSLNKITFYFIIINL